MLIDRKPDLHGVIRVLSVDLIKVEAVIHALLDTCDIVIISNIKPVFKHGLDPALTVEKIEADLTTKEFSYKQVALALQILDNSCIHLGKKLI